MAIASPEGNFIPFEKQLLVRRRTLEDVKQFTTWHQVATSLKLCIINGGPVRPAKRNIKKTQDSASLEAKGIEFEQDQRT